jgi:hypothetical protein
MDLAWISQKGKGLLVGCIGLLFVVFAFLHGQYRYFHICVAIVAFVYAYRLLKQRDTPFEKHERELRRKTM